MTTIHRPLHDGASYELTSLAPGTAGLHLHDADGDGAVVTFDRAAARQFLDDFTLIAGFQPTGATVPLETALAGSAQKLFERLAELEKTNPAAANRIAAAIASHLRSCKPQALLAAQVGR
jgi:hypothetical protein